MLVVSIVSHYDEISIKNMLLKNIKKFDRVDVNIIIRLNMKENIKKYITIRKSFKKAQFNIVSNENPYGFGKNHNLTFAQFSKPGDIFIVCNPDIVGFSDKILNQIVLKQKNNQIICPLIFESKGKIADFRRTNINFWNILGRVFSKKIGLSTSEFKWFPSVFTVFPYESYFSLEGYDENIFMYYEDYDICMRARKKGINLKILEDVHIIHPPRRSSRKNIRLLIAHMNSIFYVLKKQMIGYYK
jgi:N-acetylglucosaminyl-diphospho-decaprenol L-rhamnosyltransferase